jgi:hypothetical protein
MLLEKERKLIRTSFNVPSISGKRSTTITSAFCNVGASSSKEVGGGNAENLVEIKTSLNFREISPLFSSP